MLFSKSTSLLFSAALFISVTLAAPTRTNCHCTIVSDAPSPAQDTPSTAHWMPSDPSPSSARADACADLGPKLDVFRHTEPEVYNSYLRQSKFKLDTQVPQPIPTTVLSALAAHSKVGHGSHGENMENATAREVLEPLERIVCRSAPEHMDSYQDSILNLWLSQIVMAVAILACVAEGIHIGMRWMSQRNSDNTPISPLPEKSRLRLPGGEKRLLAIPPTNASLDVVASPGAEKKSRAYQSMRFFVTQASSGRREFIAYDDEDDDEANRPVM
ncbi:hypothetical protein T440DRAFT_524971 [Plenodomus tracheiphilus IPT5]|uniref:Uncharacterized protein n=1 Tax=Plenodomus tracheiphilus IPT5 TaxID=1408161 RepID=A0A6A7BQF5_9PLEO|nr:hypothetical protein T440DRAFT_524971 [Plenodomus tracheiphilus IPT5]